MCLLAELGSPWALHPRGPTEGGREGLKAQLSGLGQATLLGLKKPTGQQPNPGQACASWKLTGLRSRNVLHLVNPSSIIRSSATRLLDPCAFCELGCELGCELTRLWLLPHLPPTPSTTSRKTEDRIREGSGSLVEGQFVHSFIHSPLGAGCHCPGHRPHRLPDPCPHSLFLL